MKKDVHNIVCNSKKNKNKQRKKPWSLPKHSSAEFGYISCYIFIQQNTIQHEKLMK